jgi:hypothetical protein
MPLPNVARQRAGCWASDTAASAAHALFVVGSGLIKSRQPCRRSRSPLLGVPICWHSLLCVPMEADAATLLWPRTDTSRYGSSLLVLYRVYDLPEELRTRLRAKRAKAAATTAEVVQAATADSLPKLVAALRELGFRADGKTRPARLPQTAQKHKTKHKRRWLWVASRSSRTRVIDRPPPRPFSRDQPSVGARAREAFSAALTLALSRFLAA